MHPVGLYTHCRMVHGAYSVTNGFVSLKCCCCYNCKTEYAENIDIGVVRWILLDKVLLNKDVASMRLYRLFVCVLCPKPFCEFQSRLVLELCTVIFRVNFIYALRKHYIPNVARNFQIFLNFFNMFIEKSTSNVLCHDI